MSTPPDAEHAAGVATREDTGRSCPYCRFPLKEGDAAVRCGSCSAPHHADCWSDNDGCAIVACVGGPGPNSSGPEPPTAVLPPAPQVRRRTVAVDPPAVPLAPSPATVAAASPPPAVAVQPPARAQRNGPWILAAALVLALAIGGAALAVTLTESDEPSSPSSSSEASPPPEPAEEEEGTPPPPDEEEPTGSAGETADTVPALSERITGRGWVAEMPSSADGWTMDGPESNNGGRQIVRTIEGPAGEVITVVHTPDARARPLEKYIVDTLPMATAAEETELVVVDDFPTPACESVRCSDILLNDSAYGGIALLVNGERGDETFAVADAIARTVRSTDEADTDPHLLAPAPGSDESAAPETYGP